MIHSLHTTATRLRDAGIAPDGLATYVGEGRRLWFFRKRATMLPIGEAWPLGALLLTPKGELYAAGHTTRAAAFGRPQYQSVSREERRAIAAAALGGGFAAGAVVHYDALPIHPSDEELLALGPDSPVGVWRGELRVRWRPGASLESAPTLGSYLAERAELLVRPTGTE